MNRTSIEWVRNPDGTQGFTWNASVGCSRGCPYCYARRIATTRLAHLCEKCGRFEPHLHPERLDEPLRRKKPAGIFVCSMGELFDPLLPDSERERVLAVIREARQHRFYLLTKRPRWIWNSDSPRFGQNVWMGISCDQRDAEHDDIQRLNLLDARVETRFVSFEPLLGPGAYVNTWLDWIIIGAQTGPNAIKPKREWVTQIIEQADAAGIPVFIKDNLIRIYPDLPHRQEMPV